MTVYIRRWQYARVHWTYIYGAGTALVKGKNDRVLRWTSDLQHYKFRVVHVAGLDNIEADLLS